MRKQKFKKKTLPGRQAARDIVIPRNPFSKLVTLVFPPPDRPGNCDSLFSFGSLMPAFLAKLVSRPQSKAPPSFERISSTFCTCSSLPSAMSVHRTGLNQDSARVATDWQIKPTIRKPFNCFCITQIATCIRTLTGGRFAFGCRFRMFSRTGHSHTSFRRASRHARVAPSAAGHPQEFRRSAEVLSDS